MTNQQGAPEALRLAELLELAPEDGIEPQTAEDAAAELRRLHAENEALASKLKAYEDLDKAASDVQLLRMGYAAARLEIESLKACTWSEPVAWLVCTEEGDPDMVFLSQHEAQQYLEDDEHPTPLYAHPSPPDGMVGWWVSVDERLPEPGVPVLLDIGKEYPIRAMWAAKFTLPVGLEDDSGFGEHDGLTDEWYCPEGWYEWNECEDNHWRVTETPRAWSPLPPTTSAGSGKGE